MLMLHLDKHHILCYNVCVIDFCARPSGHREFSHNAHVVIFVRGQYARPMSFCYGLILAIFIFYGLFAQNARMNLVYGHRKRHCRSMAWRFILAFFICPKATRLWK